MRKILAIFTLALLSFSCQDDKGYAITGSAENIKDGTKIFVSEISNSNRPQRVDTTEVKDGQFELDLEDNDNPKLSFLEVEGQNGNVIFISENKEINFELFKDSLRASRVTGGKENKVLEKYLDHLKAVNKKMTEVRTEVKAAFQNQDTAKINKLRKTEEEILDNDKVFKQKLVKENKDSFVAIMALTDLLRMKSLPSSEIRKMYESLPENVKQNAIARDLGKQLENASATEIGAKAPGFTAPTPEGEELSLKDAMGKVTVIDFWAAWCKPCRVENPKVVKIYNKYHDKGLNIIGVSLDRPGQKERWLKAIEDDGLEWHHVSNLQFWNDPVAQKYGVKAIPATFILDEEGTIVARNLRGDDLEEKIKELLGEE
ncbi:redoxin domain-containing protein [Salegentibacter chungangensis]|uniref:Redoxin domain-containing protein n=1 Tax=Salegentibacter chungangensis TaxID=1335724 RepID=A0ABW3NRA7_9FLAO